MQPRRKVVRHPEKYKAFLEHLKAMRQNSDKTQEEVAAGINISRPQYTALEGGRSAVTFDNLCSLASFYQVTLTEFFRRGAL